MISKAGYNITFHEYPYSRCLSEVSKGNCDIIAEANPNVKKDTGRNSKTVQFSKKSY